MSVIIGLTGPTGSGKSSVLKSVNLNNIKIVDCDRLARKAVERGTDGLNALVRIFGNDILQSDGMLDRKKLAAAAFKNKKNTELLNRIILPFISELVRAEASGGNMIIIDAPTLFESGIDSICNKTIAVLADRDIRLQRIIKRDNLTLKEAELRIGAGKCDDFYKQNVDYVLYNNGSEQDFINRFSDTIKDIFGGYNNG